MVEFFLRFLFVYRVWKHQKHDAEKGPGYFFFFGFLMAVGNQLGPVLPPPSGPECGQPSLRAKPYSLALCIAPVTPLHNVKQSQLFMVWTNHQNLAYIRSAKRRNSQQARWALFLGCHHVTLTYQPGFRNGKPAALSCQFATTLFLDFLWTSIPPSWLFDRLSKAVHFIPVPKLPPAAETVTFGEGHL